MAVIVLSGIVCGLRETGLFIKCTAAVAAAATLYFGKGGLSEEDDPPLFYVLNRKMKLSLFMTLLLAMLFLLSFGRAALVSYHYTHGECAAFFASFEPTNPGQFDYALYLKAQGICTREAYEKQRQTARKEDAAGRGSEAAPGGDRNGGSGETYGASPQAEPEREAPLPWLLGKFRALCGRVYDTCLSQHDAGIYKAVVLGEKTEMDPAVRDLYQDAGIAHLLAISGLHISMIGSALYGLLRKKLDKTWSAAASSLVLFLYMLMTGASGSVLRAVTMLVFNFAAAAGGRKYDMRSALAASAILLLFLRPYQCMTAAFQLSFGAVAGIDLVGMNTIRRLELLKENAGDPGKDQKWVSRKNRLPAWASAAILSAGIQLSTLPVIAYHYFKYPVYGILLNFIVIPLMAAVLCSGLGVLACGLLTGTAVTLAALFFPALSFSGKMLLPAVIAAAPGHYILRFYEAVSSFSLGLPYSVVCIGRPSGLQIVLYYLLLALLIRVLTGGRLRAKREVRLRILGLAIGAVCCSFLLRYYEPRDFYVEMLDVGQGDGLVIRDCGLCILVDGGSGSRKSVGKDVLEPFLLSRGISKIDLALVSHCDQDHTNGLMYLLEPGSALQVRRLMLSAAAEGNPLYEELEQAFLKQAEDGKAGLSYLQEGDRILEEGDLAMYCIYPGTPGEDTNRNSSVVLLRKGDFTMLFTGDTTEADEAVFCMPEYGGRAGLVPEEGITVLKAAHHGSSGSNSELLLQTFRPKEAVISCGRNNRYGHPHQEVLDRFREYGVKAAGTHLDGALEIREDGSIRRSR